MVPDVYIRTPILSALGLSIGAFGLDVAGLFSSHCGPSFRSSGQVFAVLLASCIASWIISWQSLCTKISAAFEWANVYPNTFAPATKFKGSATYPP